MCSPVENAAHNLRHNKQLEFIHRLELQKYILQIVPTFFRKKIKGYFFEQRIFGNMTEGVLCLFISSIRSDGINVVEIFHSSVDIIPEQIVSKCSRKC